MAYRLSRNIEASIIDWLQSGVDSEWSSFGIRVVKAFSQVYDGTLPAICVQVITPNPVKLEIGSSTWLKNTEVSIRIFAKDDGSRLDLSDWILEKLESSINYYAYTVTGGVISAKTLSGKININKILKDEKDLANTENLAQEDKFRHIIIFNCRVSIT